MSGVTSMKMEFKSEEVSLFLSVEIKVRNVLSFFSLLQESKGFKYRLKHDSTSEIVDYSGFYYKMGFNHNETLGFQLTASHIM